MCYIKVRYKGQEITLNLRNFSIFFNNNVLDLSEICNKKNMENIFYCNNYDYSFMEVTWKNTLGKCQTALQLIGGSSTLSST